ncbi:hypothetical protein COX86_00090 [Candidatus Micrarchaeota archaeon CG_4_10_14_0_2_um_filter_60_11]|nr:MAG: hypothetical protein COY71_00185 [Candidatus Micrarchaeota archaeon CG_4_10_14_0_8_um_filter_60_7]PIZ91357.1 MAG: hypothetical protein COX86_00090 [Candidatus Micrarchaeota archaeon CG_4_10_14_0_2_um_filter_60_11]
MDKRVLIAINAVVALALLGLFFGNLDLAALWGALAAVNPALVAAALCLYFALGLLNAWRLKRLIIRFGGRRVSVSRMFWIHMQGMLLSDYTPGRSGYAFVALKARAFGVKARLGARVFGTALAADFLSRGVLAFCALALFFSRVSDPVAFGFAAGLLFLFSVFALWALTQKRRIVEELLWYVPALGEKFSEAYAEVFSRAIPRRLMAECVAASFAGAVIRGAEWLFIAAALGLSGFSLEALVFFTVLNSVVTVLSFVPLSIAGLGLQEGAGALAVYEVLGIPLAQASALMILVRFVEAGGDLLGLREWFR